MIKVEYSFIVLVIAFLLFGGWSFLKQRLMEQEEEFILYLVVQNQESFLEGIIRMFFRYLFRQGVFVRLILLVESSEDQTLAIAQRLAGEYFFELQEIMSLEEWLLSTSFQETEHKILLDLRGKDKGLAEARRIRKFIATNKLLQKRG